MQYRLDHEFLLAKATFKFSVFGYANVEFIKTKSNFFSNAPPWTPISKMFTESALGQISLLFAKSMSHLSVICSLCHFLCLFVLYLIFIPFTNVESQIGQFQKDFLGNQTG